MKKPLEGIRVVELATFVAAPTTGRFLADLGAEVIKIEQPQGDGWRDTGYKVGYFSRKHNPVFDLYNSGKKHIAINLKSPEGMEAFHKLLAQADVFVTNTRQNSLKRLGLSYEDLKEKYPDRKIRIVDSLSAASGYGLLIDAMADLRDEGKSLDEVADWAEANRLNLQIWFFSSDLTFFVKGGRVSKAVAFAGGILNIKPVLSVTDGEINILGKARGSKMGNNLLVQEISKAGGIDFTKPVLLGYSGISDALLLKYIEDSRHIWEGNLPEIRYTTVGSVIGTHAGPGAVVVAFFKN